MNDQSFSASFALPLQENTNVRDQSQASSGTKSPVLVIPEGMISSDGSVGEATPERSPKRAAAPVSETKNEPKRP